MCCSDAPVINCDRPAAAVGQTGVEMTCEVKARPEVTALYWIIDKTTGVVVTLDDSRPDYRMTNMVSYNPYTVWNPCVTREYKMILKKCNIK